MENNLEKKTENTAPETKNKNKNGFFSTVSGKTLIGVIFFTVMALLFAILDGTLKWKMTSHPILTFLFLFIAGTGVTFIVTGFTAKFTWYAFIGEVLFAVALLYAMIDVFHAIWWIVLIVVFAAVALLAMVSVLYFGNKAADSDDKKPGYKSYKERQADKDAAAKAKDEKEEIPEIKSFKD